MLNDLLFVLIGSLVLLTMIMLFRKVIVFQGSQADLLVLLLKKLEGEERENDK